MIILSSSSSSRSLSVQSKINESSNSIINSSLKILETPSLLPSLTSTKTPTFLSSLPAEEVTPKVSKESENVSKEEDSDSDNKTLTTTTKDSVSLTAGDASFADKDQTMKEITSNDKNISVRIVGNLSSKEDEREDKKDANDESASVPASMSHDDNDGNDLQGKVIISHDNDQEAEDDKKKKIVGTDKKDVKGDANFDGRLNGTGSSRLSVDQSALFLSSSSPSSLASASSKDNFSSSASVTPILASQLSDVSNVGVETLLSTKNSFGTPASSPYQEERSVLDHKEQNNEQDQKITDNMRDAEITTDEEGDKKKKKMNITDADKNIGHRSNQDNNHSISSPSSYLNTESVQRLASVADAHLDTLMMGDESSVPEGKSTSNCPVACTCSMATFEGKYSSSSSFPFPVRIFFMFIHFIPFRVSHSLYL